MAVRLPRLLDGNRREVCRLMPTALSLQLQLNAASAATMTLDLRGPLPAMHSWVEIYTAKGSAGLYRVTNTAHQARRERTYTLLHGIDTLSDCVWAAQTDYTGTAEGYLRALLACQKAVYWQLGTCQDTGQWKKTGINYDKASDLLTEFVGDRHGYYMAYDFTTWPWTLHWLRLPDTVSAEWRVSRNIHSCTVTRNDADLCTRLYFCVTSTSDVGQDGSGGGTATAVQIIDNAAAQALYGIIEKTATVDTADVADTAAWAAQFMADHAEPSVQITVDGYELARQTGDPWDSFDLGKLTRCALVDDGITVNERVVGVNYPDVLGEPEHVVVDLANRLPKFSDTIASASKTAASASATAKSASRSGGGTAKKLDHWAMVVSKQQEALDGTGLTDLWETGIELDPQTGARLYSLYQGLSSNLAELRVHNEGISTLVRKTGINDLGSADTLYSRIAQNAGEISSEVSRATGAENGLSSRISQNAGEIALKVSEGDVATQLAVELNNVTISGGNLVVDGYVSAAAFEAEQAKLNNLMTGQAQASTISTQTLRAGNAYAANLFLNNEEFAKHNIYMGGTTVSGFYLGDANLNLAHYHAITATENNGVITITQGAAQDTAGSASFDIADTRFYMDGRVSAWNDAVATVRINNSSSGTGDNTVNLASGGSVTVYAQAKAGASASSYSTYGTVTVNAEAVTIDSVNGSQGTTWGTYYIPITMTATASNGATGSNTINANASGVYTAGETAGYNTGYTEGVNDGYATGAAGVTISSVTGSAGAAHDTYYIPVTMTATASNNATGSGSVEVNAYSVYSAGYSAGYAAAPVNPTISQCYVSSFSVSRVAKYGDGYEVTGSVSIRVNFSNGTHTTYGPYSVRDVA